MLKLLMAAAIASALIPEQAYLTFRSNDFVGVITIIHRHEIIRFLSMTSQDRGVALVAYERPWISQQKK